MTALTGAATLAIAHSRILELGLQYSANFGHALMEIDCTTKATLLFAQYLLSRIIEAVRLPLQLDLTVGLLEAEGCGNIWFPLDWRNSKDNVQPASHW